MQQTPAAKEPPTPTSSGQKKMLKTFRKAVQEEVQDLGNQLLSGIEANQKIAEETKASADAAKDSADAAKDSVDDLSQKVEKMTISSDDLKQCIKKAIQDDEEFIIDPKYLLKFPVEVGMTKRESCPPSVWVRLKALPSLLANILRGDDENRLTRCVFFVKQERDGSAPNAALCFDLNERADVDGPDDDTSAVYLRPAGLKGGLVFIEIEFDNKSDEEDKEEAALSIVFSDKTEGKDLLNAALKALSKLDDLAKVTVQGTNSENPAFLPCSTDSLSALMKNVSEKCTVVFSRVAFEEGGGQYTQGDFVVQTRALLWLRRSSFNGHGESVQSCGLRELTCFVESPLRLVMEGKLACPILSVTIGVRNGGVSHVSIIDVKLDESEFEELKDLCRLARAEGWKISRDPDDISPSKNRYVVLRGVKCGDLNKGSSNVFEDVSGTASSAKEADASSAAAVVGTPAAPPKDVKVNADGKENCKEEAAKKPGMNATTAAALEKAAVATKAPVAASKGREDDGAGDAKTSGKATRGKAAHSSKTRNKNGANESAARRVTRASASLEGRRITRSQSTKK